LQGNEETILGMKVYSLGRDIHLALGLRAKARYKPRAEFDVKEGEFVINLTKELVSIAKKILEK